MKKNQSNLYVENKRLVWLDVLKGLLMFFVIWGHCCITKPIIFWIYFFHMPAFFFLSGISTGLSKYNYNLKQFTLNKVSTLLIPYFLLNIMVLPIRYWTDIIGKTQKQSLYDLLCGVFISNNDYRYEMVSNTLWFIPCLFLTSVLFYIIKRISKQDIQIIILTILVVLISNLSGLTTTNNAGIWHYKAAIMALPFYSIGYILIKNKDVIVSKLKQYRIIIMLLCLILGSILGKINGFVSMIHNDYNNILLWYLSSFLLIGFWVLVVYNLKDIKHIKHKYFENILLFIGINTLIYMAFHVPLKRVIVYYFPTLITTEFKVILLVIILCLILVPISKILSKFINKIVNNSKEKLVKV